MKVTCPQGQSVRLQTSSQKKAFVAHFAAAECASCPLADKCPTQPGKCDPRHHLRFTQANAHAAQRRRRSREQQQEGRNLRAAVEATVRSVKHPFPAGKLPVRGKFRVACLLIGSAAVANIRRIQRHLESQMKAQKQQNTAPETGKSAQERPSFSVFAITNLALAAFRSLTKPQTLSVCC